MPTIPTRSSVSTLLTIPTVSRIGSHPKRPTALTTTQLECRFTFQTSSYDASRTFPQPIWKYERYGFWRLVGWQRTASAQVHFFKQNLCRFTYFQHRRCSSSRNSLRGIHSTHPSITRQFAPKPHKAIQPIPMVFNGVYQYSIVFYSVQKFSISIISDQSSWLGLDKGKDILFNSYNPQWSKIASKCLVCHPLCGLCSMVYVQL